MFPEKYQLFGIGKIWFLAISILTNTVAAIWRDKKLYPCYLKLEKLVHNNQEHGKNVSQLFGIGKIWFLAVSILTNTVAAISRDKKLYPCYLETK